MTGAVITAAQTLPRTHRCDATISQTPCEFGFVPVTCSQVVGVRTFLSSSGLRVGYCPIEGHEASVRRRFVERVEVARPPIVVEFTSEAERHERHGGDENADPENCVVCYQALDSFLRYGVAL